MKRVLRFDLVSEQDILQFLQDMNDQGYKLVKKNIFWVFEKTDEKLKYQIDYYSKDKKDNDEYNYILKRQGYKFVCGNKDIIIYFNKNLDAEDIVSDYEFADNAKVISGVKFILPIFIVIALFCFIFTMTQFFDFNKVEFYFYNTSYCIMLYEALLTLFLIVRLIKNYIKNCHYKGDDRNLKYYNKCKL